MNKDSLVLFIAAVTMAGGAAWTGRALLAAEPEPEPVVIVEPVEAPLIETVRVLVAANDLTVGDLVDGQSLTWREMHPQDVSPFYLQPDDVSLTSLYGAALKKPLKVNQPMLPEMLVRPGEPGFLSVVLRSGMRAVSIPTGAVQTSSGLVSAGDWVDVVLGLNASSVGSEASSGLPNIKAQTIVSKVRVLALNNQVENIGTAVGDTKTTEKNIRSYVTVTLEVTPEMAEKLAIAKELGTLLLALRPAEEEGQELAQLTRVTTLQETTQLFSPVPEKEVPSVKVYLGDELREVSFPGY